jgi:sporulation protein YlmC with PRC-barrel domain
LIINGSGKMMGLFGKESEEIVVPWKNIIRIGSDVILVEVPSTFVRKPLNFEQAPTTRKR